MAEQTTDLAQGVLPATGHQLIFTNHTAGERRVIVRVQAGSAAGGIYGQLLEIDGNGTQTRWDVRDSSGNAQLVGVRVRDGHWLVADALANQGFTWRIVQIL